MPINHPEQGKNSHKYLLIYDVQQGMIYRFGTTGVFHLVIVLASCLRCLALHFCRQRTKPV
jgi:hypothetical protein